MKRAGLTAGLLVALGANVAAAQEWSLAEAAAPFEGTTIKALFLDRPGYVAAQELIPQFEEATGIDVEWEILPYENSRERGVLDFTGATGEFDIVLVDVVWIGEYAASGWLTPLETFTADPALADPNLNLEGFFPVLLDSFGTWDGVVYGLPFDNYSGLLYYNRCLLEGAGFSEPPATWTQLLEEYAPALNNPEEDVYAFALQSRRGETQSADSFMRMLWPFGGALIDPETFEPTLQSEASLEGLNFRQALMEYMPEGIVDYDHSEAVNAFAQGRVAMITEWSSFYSTIVDPESSTVIDCLAVATEPEGSAGLKPALGGFSLGVNAFSSPEEQAASYLFIQWITSEELALLYVEAGGVSGRTSVYENPEVAEAYPYVEPLVSSWQADTAVPFFRPRFPEWPQISEIIADYGTRIMLGDLSVEEGAASLDEQVRAILGEGGYYADRPKIQ